MPHYAIPAAYQASNDGEHFAYRWLIRVYRTAPKKLTHLPSSLGLTVCELFDIIEPHTQMSQLT